MKFLSAVQWGKIGIEVASIVAGVLLALAANEWNNQRNQSEKMAVAMVHIASELQANERLLEAIHVANEAVLKAMEKGEGSNNFVPGLQIRDTAWKAFIASGLSDGLDIELLYSLYSYYALQDVYHSLGYQTIDRIASTRSLLVALDKSIDQENTMLADQLGLLVNIEAVLIEELVKLQVQLKGTIK